MFMVSMTSIFLVVQLWISPSWVFKITTNYRWCFGFERGYNKSSISMGKTRSHQEFHWYLYCWRSKKWGIHVLWWWSCAHLVHDLGSYGWHAIHVSWNKEPCSFSLIFLNWKIKISLFGYSLVEYDPQNTKASSKYW